MTYRARVRFGWPPLLLPVLMLFHNVLILFHNLSANVRIHKTMVTWSEGAEFTSSCGWGFRESCATDCRNVV